MDKKKELAEDVNHEGVVIVHSDTIVDPWTVVVETFHTSVTYSAVTRSDSSQNLTLWAQLGRIKFFYEF